MFAINLYILDKPNVNRYFFVFSSKHLISPFGQSPHNFVQKYQVYKDRTPL